MCYCEYSWSIMIICKSSRWIAKHHEYSRCFANIAIKLRIFMITLRLFSILLWYIANIRNVVIFFFWCSTEASVENILVKFINMFFLKFLNCCNKLNAISFTYNFIDVLIYVCKYHVSTTFHWFDFSPESPPSKIDFWQSVAWKPHKMP